MIVEKKAGRLYYGIGRSFPTKAFRFYKFSLMNTGAGHSFVTKKMERIFFLLIFCFLWGTHLLISRYYGGSLRGEDGQYYYATLRSMVFDFDFDFKNELMEMTPDPAIVFPQIVPSTERISNKYGIGWALVALPGYLLIHGVMMSGEVLFHWGPITGYESIYQLGATTTHVIFAWLGFVITYKVLIHFFSPMVSGMSLLFILFGSPLWFYSTDAVYMAHAAGFCMVAFFIYSIVRITLCSPVPAWLWLLLGYSGSMMVVIRYSNMVFFSVCLFLLIVFFHEKRDSWLLFFLTSTKHIASRFFLFLAGGLPPLLLQLIFWHSVFGCWLSYSYGEEGFNWLHPRILLSLFSSKHGWFFFSPVSGMALLGLAVIFLFPAQKYMRLLSGALFAGLMALTYLNASWHCWWFGGAFGARAYLETSTILSFGFARLLSHSSGVVKSLCIILGIIFVLWTMVLLFYYYAGDLSKTGDTSLSVIFHLIQNTFP